MRVKKCRICNRTYPPDLAVRFCIHCGGLLSLIDVENYDTCSTCQAIILPGATYCHRCGGVLPSSDEKAVYESTAEEATSMDQTAEDEHTDAGEGKTAHAIPAASETQPASDGVPSAEEEEYTLESLLTNGVNPHVDAASEPDDALSDLFTFGDFSGMKDDSGLKLDGVSDRLQDFSLEGETAITPTEHVDVIGDSELAAPTPTGHFDVDKPVQVAVIERPTGAAENSTSSTSVTKGTKKLSFGLPPIPWWGWVGSGILLVFILGYFLILPLITNQPSDVLETEEVEETVETRVQEPQEKPAPVVVETPPPGEPIVIYTSSVKLLDAPSKDATSIDVAVKARNHASLIQVEDTYALIRTEEGMEGWIPQRHGGMHTYMLEEDYNNRKLKSPRITSPKSGSAFSHFPRTVKVSWSRIYDPESVSYSIRAQYGSGDATWWRLDTPRASSRTSMTIDFPGAYAGRVKVTASTRDGHSSSSPWVSFRFTQ